jgi:hypothetical protein
VGHLEDVAGPTFPVIFPFLQIYTRQIGFARRAGKNGTDVGFASRVEGLCASGTREKCMGYVMLLPGLSLLGATLRCLEVTGRDVKSRRVWKLGH